jgi:hypothetical protein
MDVSKIFDDIAKSILSLDISKLLNNLKPFAVIIALIAMVVILIGAFFSLVTQF